MTVTTCWVIAGDGQALTGVPYGHRGRRLKRRFVVLRIICEIIAVMRVVTSIGTVGLLLVAHLQHATLLLPQLGFLFAATEGGLHKIKYGCWFGVHVLMVVRVPIYRVVKVEAKEAQTVSLVALSVQDMCVPHFIHQLVKTQWTGSCVW